MLDIHTGVCMNVQWALKRHRSSSYPRCPGKGSRGRAYQ